MQIQMTSEI